MKLDADNGRISIEHTDAVTIKNISANPSPAQLFWLGFFFASGVLIAALAIATLALALNNPILTLMMGMLK